MHFSSFRQQKYLIRVLVAALALCAAVGASASGAEREDTPSCWPGEPGSDPEQCPPNDERYPGHWEYKSTIPPEVDRERMHPAEVALGAIGISLDAAWQHTTGRDDVVIAVLDSGIRWDHQDLINKIYLNRGELPFPQGSSAHDANGDGLFDVRDYRGDERVADRNENGFLDAEDLILTFSDCKDDDGNGYPDDISGYDLFGESYCGFAGGDNNPLDDTDFGHGTGIATTAAGETNNRIGDAGVCPRCRVLPVRVGDSFVVDANRFARGVIFAVNSGASVIGSALGAYNNTPAARAAIDLAYERGVPVIASAADEYSYHHNYPSVYNHALYVNAVRYNHANDYREASTFWGVNPCTNFGARVWVTMPATSCSSGATSRLAGVAGLIESIAREEGLGDLTAEEVYQILRLTADDLDNSSPDWGGMRYPARAGFDQLYGYGRVNVLRAVQLIKQRRIPPTADLAGPTWFAVHSPARERFLAISGTLRVRDGAPGAYALDYAVGVEPAEADYVRVAAETIVGEKSGRLGVLDFQRLPLPRGPAPRNRDERDNFSVTLRLRVTDAHGLTGEARRSFFVLDDPAWKRHFPVELGASGEAPPLLADLDGDGRDEIVLPSADGLLRIVNWHPGGLRTIRAPLDDAPPLGPSSAGYPRETVIRAAAVGDLHGRGRSSIVVVSKDGRVYAFSPAGERLAGFPVSIDPALAKPTTSTQIIEHGVLARPVLADLDGKPGLEIVVAALDGHLYVWRHDATLLAGFPVAVEVADPAERRAKLVSTPAVGDIDGDGRPEIVLGSNGQSEGLSEAFAVRGEGNLHPDGPFLKGWRPLRLPAVRPELLPTVASGVQMDPVLVDVDDDRDLEIVLYAVTGSSIVLVDQDAANGPRILSEYAMTPGPDSAFRDTTFLGGTGSPLVADTDSDGRLELYAPLLPLRIITLRAKPGVPLDVPLGLGGWPLLASSAGGGRVPMLRTYPRRMEDLMILARATAADVDGDGMLEILMGSGGYLIHAFKIGGAEALGFPKFTGGWIFSAPAVGDLDGDGIEELVSVTREGYLFAWELAAPQRDVRNR